MDNELQKFPRLARAANLRVRQAINLWLTEHPEYVASATNRALFADYFDRNGILVPGIAALNAAYLELRSQLELTPEATCMKVISLKGTGPTVRKVAFSL